MSGENGFAERRVELRGGSEVLIRAITPHDKRALRDGFERLSPSSRYRRFLTPMARLTDRQLAYLTELDHRDHEALVAELRPGGEGLGVARFVRDAEDPGVAEAAVAIVDEWQGNGLGTALLQALAGRARELGIERFRCLVFTDNGEMIELLRQLGPLSESERGGGAVELEVELPLAAEGAGHELLAVLRSAAVEALELLRAPIGRG